MLLTSTQLNTLSFKGNIISKDNIINSDSIKDVKSAVIVKTKDDEELILSGETLANFNKALLAVKDKDININLTTLKEENQLILSPIFKEEGDLNQKGETAIIKANKNGVSIELKEGPIDCEAQQIDGALLAEGDISVWNENAIIGKNNEQYSISSQSNVEFYGTKTEGSIYARGDIHQDGKRAEIGANSNGDALVSDIGRIDSNADLIKGNVRADGNIHLNFIEQEIDGLVYSNSGGIDICSQKVAKSITACRNISHRNEISSVGMDTLNISYKSECGEVFTKAKNIEGYIAAEKDINHFNKNAEIGASPKGVSYYSPAKIDTSAKLIKGSIIGEGVNQDNTDATIGKDELNHSINAGYSIVSCKAKRLEGAIHCKERLFQENKDATIGKDKKGNSILAHNVKKCNAKKLEGGIKATNNIRQTNNNAVIGKGYFDMSLSAGQDVFTNAVKYNGAIEAGYNIVQLNAKAIIGKDKYGSSMRSKQGHIVTNAKLIEGDVIAQKDIFIVGDVEVKGQIKSETGKVYLVNDKPKEDYNLANNKLFDVKRISYQKFEELMADSQYKNLAEGLTNYKELIKKDEES